MCRLNDSSIELVLIKLAYETNHEARLKEHKEACLRGEQEKSAVADHAWSNHHPILWKEASVVDQARTRKELLLKEALHIGLSSEEQRFNRDVGLELQGCWVSTLKALGK